jgi:Lsr2
MTRQPEPFTRGQVNPLALAEALALTGGDSRRQIRWQSPTSCLVVNHPGWQPHPVPLGPARAAEPVPELSAADKRAARAWAKAHGITVSDRGRLPAEVIDRWHAAGRPS